MTCTMDIVFCTFSANRFDTIVANICCSVFALPGRAGSATFSGWRLNICVSVFCLSAIGNIISYLFTNLLYIISARDDRFANVFINNPTVYKSQVYYIVENLYWPPSACGRHRINSRHLIENIYPKLHFVVEKNRLWFFRWIIFFWNRNARV